MEKEIRFVETTAGECLTEMFVRAVARRYHYEWKDQKKLRQVAADIRSALEGQEGFYCILPDRLDNFLKKENKKGEYYAGVILTLGEGVDRLQDIYNDKGDMERAYMAEVMTGELLRNAYLQFSGWLLKNSCYETESFHFFGTEEEFPMERMTKLLDYQSEKKVTCNGAYCLKPKKSVVFVAKLRNQRKNVESGREKNISAAMCAACENKNCIYKIS